eukprot:926587_1
MYLSSVIVIIGVFVTASSTSSLNLPHSKISEYKHDTNLMRRLQSSESDDSRVEIGYSKQLIGIHSSSSDSDSAYDKQYEDTLYPTKFATTTPTPVPPQHTFCNGPRHTGEYNGVPIQIEVYVEDKSDITFDASTSLFTVAHIEARHNSGLIDQINGDVLTIYDQPGNRNYLFTFTADQPSTTGIQYTFNIGCVTYAPTIPSISVISPTKYPSKYPTKYPTIPSIPPTKYPTKY